MSAENVAENILAAVFLQAKEIRGDKQVLLPILPEKSDKFDLQVTIRPLMSKRRSEPFAYSASQPPRSGLHSQSQSVST